MPDNIQFDTDQPQFGSRPVFSQPRVSGMANWLMKKGIIKDESQAGSILGGIVIFNFILTALVIYFFVI